MSVPDQRFLPAQLSTHVGEVIRLDCDNRYGVDPSRYLNDVLHRLSSTPATRLAELLSNVWFLMAHPTVARVRPASLDAAVRRGDNRGVPSDSYFLRPVLAAIVGILTEGCLHMSDNNLDHLETMLASVAPSRRNFLRGVLVAGAGTSAALSLPTSILLADEDEDSNGKGKGKGDGKGKGKGKGKGDETPPHELILTEIRAIRKLVGAPKEKEDEPADEDEPPHELILRKLRDLRKFLETRPENQK
jgi:hypothetical protein